MKFATALLIAGASAVSHDTEVAFVHYMAEHGKSYATKEEYEFRLNIFAKKLAFIEEHNALNADDHVVGLNAMADWTDHEYKKLLGYKAHQKTANKNVTAPVGDVPASVDWRTEGAVTPVKNQGQCGSCWSFSATGAMEGAYKLSGHDLTSFSEQQLVDCDKQSQGCNGGLMDFAFTYIEANAADTESSYPYTGRDGSCNTSISGVAKLTGFSDVTPNDPVALQAALAVGPVAIAVDAASLGWQLYHGGILKRFCGTSLDHGVLAVGYGTEKGQDFWIVKNSWGASWGEKGYLRIARDMSKKAAGVCGLQSQPSQPQF